MAKKRTVQSVLDQILRLHVSEVAPVAATPEQERELAALVGAVPDDLAAFYRVAANADEALPPADHDWLSLDDALGATATLREDFEEARSLFALADSHSGDYPCFDCASGRIVFWDHEAAGATKVAPDLASYLGRALVEAKELAGDRKAAAAAAVLCEERATAAVPTFPLRPKKITLEPNAMVRKYDRDGIEALIFLETTKRLARGWQSTHFHEEGSDVERTVEASGLAIAYDAGSSRLFAAGRDEISVTDTRAEGAQLGWVPTTYRVWPTTRLQAPSGLGPLVAIAPGGKLAASASLRGTVALWSMDDLPELAPPENLELARALESESLEIGKPLRTMKHPNLLQRLRFSPDGSLVATLSEDELFLWDVATGAARASWRGQAMWGVDFSADGERVFVGANVDAENVTIFDRDGKRLATWTAPHPVMDVRLVSPTVLATLGLDQLTLHDAETGAVHCKTKRKRKKSDVWSESRIADVRDDAIITLSPAAILRVS